MTLILPMRRLVFCNYLFDDPLPHFLLQELRNTVGNIPLAWYEDYPHRGYDIEGRTIIKPQSIDEVRVISWRVFIQILRKYFLPNCTNVNITRLFNFEVSIG